MRRLEIDPGGEHLLPYAEKQLGALKKWMTGGFVERKYWTKTIMVDSGEVITLQVSNGFDVIRITGGGGSQYVLATMPNPVPYRGLTIGYELMNFVTGGGGITADAVTRVVLSSGELLVNEVLPYFQALTFPIPPPYVLYDIYGPENVKWNGGSGLWILHHLQTYNGNQFGGEIRLDHITPFDVPEDVFYPMVKTVPEFFGGTGVVRQDPATYAATWNAGYAEGVARRKAWFKKNNETVLAQLKVGTLPYRWRYQLQQNAPVSNKTYRPIVITEEIVDVVLSDTTASLAVGLNGVKTTQRKATLNYGIPVVQPDGSTEIENRETIIVGSRVTTTIRHAHKNGGTTDTQSGTYTDWYEMQAGFSFVYNTLGFSAAYHPFQFKKDKVTAGYGGGLGLVWNGMRCPDASSIDGVAPYIADSTWLAVPSYNLSASLYTPVIPVVLNTLAGTAPDFILQYRKDVKPKYDKTGVLASTVWNDSALVDNQTVTLIPFGIVKDGKSLGMFAHTDDASGATQIEVYGKATFVYKYDTGAFTFRSWQGLPDATDGLKVLSRSVVFPAGMSFLGGNFIGHANDSLLQTAFDILAVAATDVNPDAKVVAELGKAAQTAGDRAYTMTNLSVGSPGGPEAGNILKAAVIAAVTASKITAANYRKVLRADVTAGLPGAIFQAVEQAVVLRVAANPNLDIAATTTSLTLNLTKALQVNSPAKNCIIKYGGLKWPDVVDAAKISNANLKDADAVTVKDPTTGLALSQDKQADLVLTAIVIAALKG